MGETSVRCEMSDGIATLTLNRPERLSALGGTLREISATRSRGPAPPTACG
jgi:enoyl-CoA hydratase/carnithine racemase